MLKITWIAAASLAFALTAQAASPPLSLPQNAKVVEHSDTIAWDFVEGLTTEVGPRMAGTEAEARARAWASAWLKANGFSKVAIEPYRMQTWVRGTEHAWVTAPFAQPMRITALGTSASTGDAGLEAEVVRFASYADLEAAPAGSLTGKIAFIDHAMKPTQDGSGYGFAGPARWTGPGLAASKGAVATVIRSIGTENHRNPHAGGTTFADGVTPTPAGALSNPDADNLARMFARAGGKPIRMKLVLTPRNLGETGSGNVVGEITGRDPKLAPVLLACHLDSWDLGTGAIDNAAGCAIISAAARHVAEYGRPLRTVRVLFAGAEEVGGFGSKAYAAAHKGQPVFAGLESDFGADRVWRLESNFTNSDPALYKQLVGVVAAFGVEAGAGEAHGGEDLEWVRQNDAPIVDLNQDGTHYFDLHHTPDDTLDKIDPVQLRQNVAVWTVVVGTLANRAEAIATAK